MVKPNFRTNSNGLPIVKDKEIDSIVEQLLTQYKPELLTNPTALDVDDFALFFLKLNQHFDYLSNCGCIWGRMVFNNTHKVPVYVPELNQADYISAKEGTIIIDNTLLEDKTEYRYRSTMTHECGHWIFHRNMFLVDEQQMNLFNEIPQPSILCRAIDIDGYPSIRRQLITPHDWMEHHAKYFSASLLMPKKAVEMVCSEVNSEIRYQNIVIANERLVRYIANVFQVSPTSAQIRIKQLGLDIKPKPEIVGRSFWALNDLPSYFELIQDM